MAKDISYATLTRKQLEQIGEPQTTKVSQGAAPDLMSMLLTYFMLKNSDFFGKKKPEAKAEPAATPAATPAPAVPGTYSDPVKGPTQASGLVSQTMTPPADANGLLQALFGGGLQGVPGISDTGLGMNPFQTMMFLRLFGGMGQGTNPRLPNK